MVKRHSKGANIAFSLYLLLKIIHNTVYEVDHAQLSLVSTMMICSILLSLLFFNAAFVRGD